MTEKQDARTQIETERGRVQHAMVSIIDEQDRLERQREVLNAELVGLNFALTLLPEPAKRGRKPAVKSTWKLGKASKPRTAGPDPATQIAQGRPADDVRTGEPAPSSAAMNASLTTQHAAELLAGTHTKGHARPVAAE